MSPLTSPVVKWAEPLSTWSHLLCILWWCGALVPSSVHFVMVWCTAGVSLSATVWKLYVCWCYFTKRSHFLYELCSQPLASWPAACCCCASGFPATNHRPHIGCQFSVVGFTATPCGGVASHALGLWWCTETKAQIKMLMMKYLLTGPQVWSMKTLIHFGSKGSTRMNIQLSND